MKKIAEPLEFEIRLKKNETDIQKLADSFSSRIEKGLRDATNRLGLGKFGPVSAPSGGGGGGGLLSNLSSATKTGVAAGLVAGGVVTLLGGISNALKDMPVVAAIMKMFKLIMTILLLPLIPILKPALMAMATFAKDLAKLLMPDTAEAQKGAGIGGLIGAAIGTVLAGPGVGTLIGGIIGAAIGTVIGKEGKEAIVGYFLEGLGKIFGTLVERVIPYIFDNIIGPGVAGIITILGNLFRIGAVEPTRKIFESIGKVFNDIDTLLGSPLKTIGNTLISIKDGLASFLDSFIEWFNNLPFPFKIPVACKESPYNKGQSKWQPENYSYLNPPPPALEQFYASIGAGQAATMPSAGGGNSGSVPDYASMTPQERGSLGPQPITWTDFLMTPHGTISHSPDDFIIGTKNPSKLGGGSIININIDRPTVRSESDIKDLVKQISLELYKAQRRYVSYA